MKTKNIAPKKVLVVFGTRPETIKLAPLIRAMEADPRFNPITVFTGQHKEMVTPILDWFQITPTHTLSVMAHKQPLAHLSGKLLYGLHNIMEAENPDTIMVQGDTTTAFMAALNAYYHYDFFIRTNTQETRHKLEIAHIEAGLRTGCNYSPFPEEVNRKLIGHMATHHFAPSHIATTALYDENITDNVFTTGNTVIDALFETVELLKTNPRNPLPQVPAGAKMVLITGHRRESYGDGFESICKAIQLLAGIHPNTYFVYPVHLNKHVQGPVNKMLGGIKNIILTQPMDYPDFVAAMQRSSLLLTDSGGLQEEGPSLGKPVLVMRDLTERPDAILAGTAKIVGTNVEKIVHETSELLTNKAAYKKMATAMNPYGDGLATQRILNILAGEAAVENMFNVELAA